MDMNNLESIIKSRGTQYVLLAGRTLMIYDQHDKLEKSLSLSKDDADALISRFPFLKK